MSNKIVGKEATAAINDEKKRFGKGKIVIPREEGVKEAKDWVDNGNQR